MSTNYDHITFLFCHVHCHAGAATLGYLVWKQVKDTPKGTYIAKHAAVYTWPIFSIVIVHYIGT